MNKRLIPIGLDQESENIANKLCRLFAKIAAAGKYMDIHCFPTTIGVIAGFDKYFHNEININELEAKIEKIINSIPDHKGK